MYIRILQQGTCIDLHFIFYSYIAPINEDTVESRSVQNDRKKII